MPQRIQGGDDLGLLVGDDTDFLEVDPDIGQVLRDKADVLVFGSPGKDLVADHQNSRGNNLAHDLSLAVSRRCSQNSRKPGRGILLQIVHPRTLASRQVAG